MDTEGVIKVVTGIILSLGGGGLIVLKLSDYLGRVWANRLMLNERNKYEQDMESLRSRLERENGQSISALKSELEIYKEKHLKGHLDKLTIYRLVTDVVVEVLGDLDQADIAGQPRSDVTARLDQFNRSRMKVYGYLAMLAPQFVMDAHDALTDFLLEVVGGNRPYVWSEIRILVISLLNEFRKDIGIDASPIEYRGRL